MKIPLASAGKGELSPEGKFRGISSFAVDSQVLLVCCFVNLD